MDNSVLIVLLALGVMVLMDIYEVYKGWRRKRLKYSFKK